MPSTRDSSSLWPLYLAVFVAVLGFTLVAPFFPSYVMGLGASYTLLGFIISIYGAAQLAVQVPIGRLSDRMGRKRLMLLGMMTFALLPPLYIYAENAYTLLFIRALGGVGAALVWPTAMALIIDQSRSQCRGAAMGYYNASFFSALALGPFLGGALYDHMGLEAPFYFWALMGITSIIIVTFKVPESRKILLKESQQPQRGDEPLLAPGYAITFLACCAVILWSGVVAGFNITLLPSYARALGFSITDIGLIYLVYGGMTAISNIYFGHLADRGRRRLLILLGSLAGLISFASLSLAASLIQVMLLFAGLGLGLGICGPAAAALVADITCASRRGETYGIFNTARMSGVVIGPIVAGLAADMQGIKGALYAFTLIALAVTLAAVAIREQEEDPESAPDEDGIGQD